MQTNTKNKGKTWMAIVLAVMLLMTAAVIAWISALENAGLVNAVDETVEFWEGATAEEFEGGSGTMESPYLISSGGQLSLLSGIVDRTVTGYGGASITDYSSFNSASVYYELTEDIYLNDISGWQNWETINSGLNSWTPIGSTAYPFKGHFDGKGKVIGGVYLNTSASDYQGLFGYMAGSVKNLTVKESLISGRSYIGGIAGAVRDGEINNCANTGNIKGEQYTGGITGQLKTDIIIPAIKNCTNNGTITGFYVHGSRSTVIGGIAGDNNGVVDNCNNSGNLFLDSKGHVGGVVGQNSYQVTNCYNTGSISIKHNTAERYASSNIGGVVGSNNVSGVSANSNIYIKNSFNTGKITGTANEVGGVAGYSYYDVSDCYNSGEISVSVNTASGLGGAIGAANSCFIKRCYNSGTVTDVSNSSFTGGLIGKLTYSGQLTANVDSCYNAGSVIKSADIKNGSLIGYANGKVNVSITNCYYDKSVSPTLGVVFFNQGTNIDTASDDADNNVIGLTASEMTGTNAFDTMIFASPADWSGCAPEILDNKYVIFYPQLTVFTESKNAVMRRASKESASVDYEFGDWEHVKGSEPSKHTRSCVIYAQIEECSMDEWVMILTPTCTAAGTKELRCTVCDEVLETDKIAALGHTWVNADCTTPKTCSVCTATEGGQLGHTWVNADCTTPKTCSVCTATEGGQLGHTWVNADCTTPKTCSVCTATEGGQLGHNRDAWITILAPTCTAAGIKELHCIVCDEVLDTDTITALGHIFGGWEEFTATTCTAAGEETRTCSVCGYKETRSISALGHDYEAEVTPPTYAAAGFTTYTCKVCRHSYMANNVPMLTCTVNADANSSVPSDFFDDYVLSSNLSAPERNGYEFCGWYKDTNYTTPVSIITEADLDENGNITVYAKWTPVKNPKSGLPGGAIAGIVIGSILFTALTGFAIFWFIIKKKKFADLIAIFKKD